MKENKGLELMYQLAKMLSGLEGEDFLIKDLKGEMIKESENNYNITVEIPDELRKKYRLPKIIKQNIEISDNEYQCYLNNKDDSFMKMLVGKRPKIGFLFGYYTEDGDVPEPIKIQIIETMREYFNINDENDVKNIISKKLNITLEDIDNSIVKKKINRNVNVYTKLNERKDFTTYGLDLGFLFVNSILLGLMNDSLYSIIKFKGEVYNKNEKTYMKIISDDTILSEIEDVEIGISTPLTDITPEEIFSFCIRYKDKDGACVNKLITTSLLDILFTDSIKTDMIDLMYSLYKIESKEDLDDLLEYIEYKIDEGEYDVDEMLRTFGLSDDELSKALDEEKDNNNNDDIKDENKEVAIDIETYDELSIDEMNDIIDDILND